MTQGHAKSTLSKYRVINWFVFDEFAH